MKIFLCLLTFALGLNASTKESFIATDGTKLFVRRALEADFANALISNELSVSVIADRKLRAINNHAGIYVVETESGEILGRILTGRMPLGVMPASVTEQGNLCFNNAEGITDNKTMFRLLPIFELYQSLAKKTGLTCKPVAKQREGSNQPIALAAENSHAMTVVLGGNFANLSAQEAITKLVLKEATLVTTDPGVYEPGKPLFCLSITKETLDTNNTENTFDVGKFGYFEGLDGLRNVYITIFGTNPNFERVKLLQKEYLSFLEQKNSKSE